MQIGLSITLIAAGAILKYAITADVSGIDIQVVGVILMVVGILGLAISLLILAMDRPPSQGGGYDDDRTRRLR
jgi:uncharacterized protein DUF6458